IPSDENKVHIEVLSVLWGNRLPIPEGSLPLPRYKGLKTKQKTVRDELEARRLARRSDCWLEGCLAYEERSPMQSLANI
ncbi:hypothetical protein Tco_1037011, partial [Tanacetum coccineum]